MSRFHRANDFKPARFRFHATVTRMKAIAADVFSQQEDTESHARSHESRRVDSCR